MRRTATKPETLVGNIEHVTYYNADNGGRTAATLFSLIATCERHRVEPMSYLHDVFTRIAATPINQLAPFLPDRGSPHN